jgi:hypothetical protein
MPSSYSDNKFIYCVDMMLSYLDNNDHPISKIKIQKYQDVLYYPGWGDPLKNNNYSPMDVLKSPKKYADDYKRIQDADLSYPIIVNYNNNIVDGIHRLTKAYIQNIKTLDAYIFDKKLMNKFIIGRIGEWDKLDKMPIYQLISLYYKRFCR